MREFTNLNAGEQRAVLYEKITSVEKHLVTQNGTISDNIKAINKNRRGVLVIKVVGGVLFVMFCIFTGLGVPFIPAL